MIFTRAFSSRDNEKEGQLPLISPDDRGAHAAPPSDISEVTSQTDNQALGSNLHYHLHTVQYRGLGSQEHPPSSRREWTAFRVSSGITDV